MIALAPSLVTALLLCASSVVARADPHTARRVAVYCASATAVLSIGLPLIPAVTSFALRWPPGLTVVVLPDGTARNVLVTTCAAGLLVVAMSPLASHPPATLARILRILAVSTGYLAVRHAVPAAVLWALSAWLVWSELRERDEGDGLHRLFAAYHLPSVLLFGAGTALTAIGAPTVGAVAMALGVLIRFAALPVHGWYPRFVERAPLGLVVAFGAVPIGMLTHLDSLTAWLPAPPAHGLALIGGLTAVVAALFGVVQNAPRRALAYLRMSQMGLIVFGVGGESPISVSGAVLTWQVSVLALSGFTMTLAALEARRGPLTLATPGGNLTHTPQLAGAFLLCGLATVGFPLSGGFAGEHLLVHGSVARFPLFWIALTVAVGINGMTVMRCFFALFGGSRTHHGERDLLPVEAYALTLVVGALLIGGVLPGVH
ncbi:hypothetical protein Skr01_68840 [Sphaerisporangium krabiense]|uniref:NADH-quinone oxidoreductase subunit M n=1 Tax=Sphaerisporangium krabiense TaxID=763782 RepID=A0A7W9DRB5_9ACTN|nr:proton-conducting transporter membrane subunit [Sphaerisporangium krabiense]MBB5628462.1 NADH-quinone oxidoreductase subunit M [Sphaerisporangium krabiense]GII66799.1 hypothetical protein Skr01_68840 [Sphaerisporangium krabiense]